MPIPFSDADSEAGEDLGSAGFLKLQYTSGNTCCLGALFVVSARGEPLEFGYNRARVPQPHLWRQADLRRYTQRRLTTSLLSVCSHLPWLIVCLASEVSPELFGQDLRVELPVVRVDDTVGCSRSVDTQTGEVFEEPVQVTWQAAAADTDSAARRLLEHLSVHGLLLEPFERAALGLVEVYGPHPCDSTV